MQRAIVLSGQWEESTLFNVLALFSDRESTDARDRVYGLLGLVRPHLSRKSTIQGQTRRQRFLRRQRRR